MDPGWITAAIAALTAITACCLTLGRMAWHAARALIQLLGDLNGTPARPGSPAHPGIMERLSSVETKLQSVVNETRPNGGESMRDVVHQTAADVAEVKKSVGRINSQVQNNTHAITQLTGRVEMFEAARREREDD